MLIQRNSQLSGVTRTKEINITEEQLQRWKTGERIQNIVPHLSPDDREFILTGITADEWEMLFPGVDE